MRSEFPVWVAAFIGRERERAKVADVVADARVVTLTGSGGCGKARRAVEVVGDVASRFPTRASAASHSRRTASIVPSTAHEPR